MGELGKARRYLTHVAVAPATEDHDLLSAQEQLRELLSVVDADGCERFTELIEDIQDLRRDFKRARRTAQKLSSRV
jgi:hypothetical protein